MNILLLGLIVISLDLGAGGPVAWADDAPPLAKRQLCIFDFRVDPALITTDKGPLGTIGATTGEAREAVGLRGGPLQRATRITDRVGRKKSPEELPAKVVTLYGDSLVEELHTRGVTARRCTAPMQGALLVQGEFLTVDEGNAVREATVGFGTGAPAVEVAGALTDGATLPPTLLLQFGGKNHDRKMPGGAVTLNPVVMGVKYHLAKGATEKDVKRLAGQMAADIADFLQGKKGGVEGHAKPQ